MARATFVILAVLCVGLAAAEEAVNPPPRPLHLVGDHWTPYEPPTEFPPGTDVYIIQPGDCLWDLARKYLGNPYLWPQIWEKNTYIKDAHWIYPGDPLVGVTTAAAVAEGAGEGASEGAGEAAGAGADATGAAAAQGAEAGAGTGGEVGGVAEEGGLAGDLVAVGGEDDVYCFAYLDEEGAKPSLTIVSAEQIQYQFRFATGDIVYLSGGTADGVQAGQEFFVVDPGRVLRHPQTNAKLGRVMRYVGHLRVLCAQDTTATAEILSACDAIAVGAWLKPFEPIPIPMTVLTAPCDRCELPNEKAKGTIVYCKDDIVSFGEDDVVFVDLGEADQVAPGTVCTIYRDNPVAGAPRLVLGELAVLTSGQHWASAKILRSTTPIFVGDRIELK